MENKFCPNCGTSISDDARFCPSCGCKIQTAVATKSKTPDLPKREIKTTGDMEAYLEELSEYANDSAEAALRAQIQVIRYVQSPKLYDSSFDLLFKNLKDAIKYADSPKMQDMIRERATVMIQNYVFFMEAKLQFEVKNNRAEAQGLMEDAINMLAESTADVAVIAAPGGFRRQKGIQNRPCQIDRKNDADERYKRGFFLYKSISLVDKRFQDSGKAGRVFADDRHAYIKVLQTS